MESRVTRRAIVGAGIAAATAGIVGAFAWERSDGPDANDTAIASSDFTPEAIVPTAVPPTIAASPRPSSSPRRIATAQAPVFDYSTASVLELRRALDAQTVSVRELVQAGLDRIDSRDRGEFGLGAMIEINLAALDIADERDRELRQGATRGPLHGVPVVVKDLLATADGMATTAGSLALLGNPVVRDAFLISQLREAGAILLGKTNLTEWSNFKGTVQTSGWSARGGQTRNPYRLDSSPWGSSSGSAVAVAAGIAPISLGVETDGSIACPASATSTVGMKPTVGLTSRAGVIPISFSQDSPGPMARTVADAAALLTAVAGFDPEDASNGELGWTAPAAAFATSQVGSVGSIDYTSFLDSDGLRGARIGVCRDLIYDADAITLLDRTIPDLVAAGATIIDPVSIATVGDVSSGVFEYELLITEFRYGLEKYFATYTPDGAIMSVADLIAFNDANAAEELLYNDQAVFHSAMATDTVWSDWYRTLATRNTTLTRDQGLDATLTEHRLDAIIAPSAGPPTLISLGGDDFRGSSSQLAAMSGYPLISVPLGYIDGLPVGLSFMGAAFSEPTLIRLASGFEAIHPVREVPEFIRGTLV